MSDALKEKIMEALETVEDPDLHIDIVNLGLVYGVDVDQEGNTKITMTMTSMGCPLMGSINSMINRALANIPEVNQVDVNIVWSPPWSKDKMSRYAKIALGVVDS